MTDDDFTALGPTEKFAAEQLRKALANLRAATGKLADSLDKIDDDLIDDALLDPDRKETVLVMIEPIQKMASNMSMNEVGLMMVGILLKPKAEAA